MNILFGPMYGIDLLLRYYIGNSIHYNNKGAKNAFVSSQDLAMLLVCVITTLVWRTP